MSRCRSFLRRGAFAAATVALLAVGAPLSAQSDSLVLDLERAFAVAEGNNPGYRRSLNDASLNGLEMRNTWLNTVLPRTNLTLFSTSYTGNIRRTATDPLGNPIENPDADWVFFSGTSQALSLNWTIQGKNLVNALRGQDVTNRRRRLEEELALDGVRLDVRREYYEVLEQRELLESARQLEEERRLDLELTRRLYRLADRTRVDVLSAEYDLQQQGLAIREQEAAYERALLSLRRVLGDPDLPPISLEPEPLPVFDPGTIDADRLVSLAERSNGGVRRSAAGTEAARIDLGEAKNNWWPSIGLSYSLSRNSQAQEARSLFDVSYDEDLDSNFGIRISLPFFDNFFESDAEIQRARVELNNSQEDLREQRLQAEQDVRAAVLTLKNEFETLRLRQRALEIAGEALELAREEFRLQGLSFADLRTAVQAESDARREVITARYRFVDALVDLEAAVGSRVRPEGTEAGR